MDTVTMRGGPDAPTGVFEDLHHVQSARGYVPAREIELIAERRGVHVRDVHTVASYYPYFRLKPPVPVDVRVCNDMTCHLHKANAMQSVLELKYAHLPDVVRVRDISCVGRCDRAPVVTINDRYYEHASIPDAIRLIDREIASGVSEPALPAQGAPPRSAEERGVVIDCDPYATREEQYGLIRELLAKGNVEETLQLLKAGQLRGMGGAGFPTYIKWEGCRQAISLEGGGKKFVVCNADESEPGTIKDRFILQYLPHMVIEGMMICAAIVGAQLGYLYIRHEYEPQAEILREELARVRAMGLLGAQTRSGFEMEVFVSPGGYICGEETALMEAIEGRRAEPRNKPPRTIHSGLWKSPTALNNVETFTHAVAILGKGGEWYRNAGQAEAGGRRPAGFKFVGVTGHVRNPGVFEVPMGITYRELIYGNEGAGYGGGPPAGREVIGFAPSGPSSGYLPASLLDTPMDWERLKGLGSMLGSGAVVVCADHACMLDMALTAVRFYRNESCGKCSPCRIGTQKLVDLLENWTHGVVRAGDEAMLQDLSNVLELTSICGLGKIAPAPIESVMRHFPEVMREHLEERHCRAGICFGGSAR